MEQVIYIVGSFSNLSKMNSVYSSFLESGISALISEPNQGSGVDGCLERIRRSDIVYVLNYNGYVGKSVALDIGYALALEKQVYSLEPVVEPNVSHLIAGVVSPEGLIKTLKEGGTSHHIKQVNA